VAGSGSKAERLRFGSLGHAGTPKDAALPGLLPNVPALPFLGFSKNKDRKMCTSSIGGTKIFEIYVVEE